MDRHRVGRRITGRGPFVADVARADLAVCARFRPHSPSSLSSQVLRVYRRIY